MIDYKKIGNHLKLVRERKGLSYDQIFEITRIQPSVLKQIEEGTSSVSPVLLKGFIKSYSRALGVNSQDLFDSSVKSEESKEPSSTSKEMKTDPSQIAPQKLHYIRYVLGFLAVVIVFLIVWQITNKREDSLSDNSKNQQAEIKENSNNIEDNTSLQKSEILKKTQVSQTQDQPTSLSSEKKEEAQEEQSSLFQQIKNNLWTKELLIKSPQALTIYFKSDKQSTVTKVLDPSRWFQIKAKDSIYFRLDEKPRGLIIFYNGWQLNISDEEKFFERTF